VLALRLAYTLVVMAIVVSLLRAGNPLGGLVLVPAAAVWLRHAVETGRLSRLAGRLPRP
jgi:hypothetical protein